MRIILAACLAAATMQAQSSGLFRWEGPCEIAGKMEVCRVTFPLDIDVNHQGTLRVEGVDTLSSRVGQVEASIAKLEASLDSRISAGSSTAIAGFLPGVLATSLPAAIDPLLPSIAARVAALIPAPTAPAPVSALSCPGPLLSVTSASTMAIGANWTTAAPCRIRQYANLGGPVLDGVTLTQPLRLVAPAAGTCRGWVWVERGAVRYSAGSCSMPGATGEVPAFGSHVLGRWTSQTGIITELVSSEVPELVHDSWTIQMVNAIRAGGLRGSFGTFPLGNGAIVRNTGEPPLAFGGAGGFAPREFTVELKSGQ